MTHYFLAQRYPLFTLLLIGLMLTPSLATAKNCNKYAQNAVSQNQQNQRMQCGLSGLAWNSDYGAHFAWCLIASSSDVRKETAKRSQALTGCTVAKMPPMQVPGGLGPGNNNPPAKAPRGNISRATKSRCNDYAQRAVNQYSHYLNNGCRLSGRNKYNAHYNYCISVPRKIADADWKRRMKEGNDCIGMKAAQQKAPPRNKAPQGGISKATRYRCDDYATRAVDQYNHYLNYGCRLSGRSGYDDHYKYCISVPRKIADNDWERRMKEGNACLEIKAAQKKAPPKKKASPPHANQVMPGFNERCDCYAGLEARWDSFYFRNFACRLTGRQGSNAHYNFCTQVPEKVVLEEMRRRRQEGRACETRFHKRNQNKNQPWVVPSRPKPSQLCQQYAH